MLRKQRKNSKRKKSIQVVIQQPEQPRNATQQNDLNTTQVTNATLNTSVIEVKEQKPKKKISDILTSFMEIIEPEPKRSKREITKEILDIQGKIDNPKYSYFETYQKLSFDLMELILDLLHCYTRNYDPQLDKDNKDLNRKIQNLMSKVKKFLTIINKENSSKKKNENDQKYIHLYIKSLTIIGLFGLKTSRVFFDLPIYFNVFPTLLRYQLKINPVIVSKFYCLVLIRLLINEEKRNSEKVFQISKNFFYFLGKSLINFENETALNIAIVVFSRKKNLDEFDSKMMKQLIFLCLFFDTATWIRDSFREHRIDLEGFFFFQDIEILAKFKSEKTSKLILMKKMARKNQREQKNLMLKILNFLLEKLVLLDKKNNRRSSNPNYKVLVTNEQQDVLSKKVFEGSKLNSKLKLFNNGKKQRSKRAGGSHRQKSFKSFFDNGLFLSAKGSKNQERSIKIFEKSLKRYEDNRSRSSTRGMRLFKRVKSERTSPKRTKQNYSVKSNFKKTRSSRTSVRRFKSLDTNADQPGLGFSKFRISNQSNLDDQKAGLLDFSSSGRRKRTWSYSKKEIIKIKKDALKKSGRLMFSKPRRRRDDSSRADDTSDFIIKNNTSQFSFDKRKNNHAFIGDDYRSGASRIIEENDEDEPSFDNVLENLVIENNFLKGNESRRRSVNQSLSMVFDEKDIGTPPVSSRRKIEIKKSFESSKEKKEKKKERKRNSVKLWSDIEKIDFRKNQKRNNPTTLLNKRPVSKKSRSLGRKIRRLKVINRRESRSRRSFVSMGKVKNTYEAKSNGKRSQSKNSSKKSRKSKLSKKRKMVDKKRATLLAFVNETQSEKEESSEDVEKPTLEEECYKDHTEIISPLALTKRPRFNIQGIGMRQRSKTFITERQSSSDSDHKNPEDVNLGFSPFVKEHTKKDDDYYIKPDERLRRPSLNHTVIVSGRSRRHSIFTPMNDSQASIAYRKAVLANLEHKSNENKNASSKDFNKLSDSLNTSPRRPKVPLPPKRDSFKLSAIETKANRLPLSHRRQKSHQILHDFQDQNPHPKSRFGKWDSISNKNLTNNQNSSFEKMALLKSSSGNTNLRSRKAINSLYNESRDSNIMEKSKNLLTNSDIFFNDEDRKKGLTVESQKHITFKALNREWTSPKTITNLGNRNKSSKNFGEFVNDFKRLNTIDDRIEQVRSKNTIQEEERREYTVHSFFLFMKRQKLKKIRLSFDLVRLFHGPILPYSGFRSSRNIVYSDNILNNFYKENRNFVQWKEDDLRIKGFLPIYDSADSIVFDNMDKLDEIKKREITLKANRVKEFTEKMQPHGYKALNLFWSKSAIFSKDIFKSRLYEVKKEDMDNAMCDFGVNFWKSKEFLLKFDICKSQEEKEKYSIIKKLGSSQKLEPVKLRIHFPRHSGVVIAKLIMNYAFFSEMDDIKNPNFNLLVNFLENKLGNFDNGIISQFCLRLNQLLSRDIDKKKRIKIMFGFFLDLLRGESVFIQNGNSFDTIFGEKSKKLIRVKRMFIQKKLKNKEIQKKLTEIPKMKILEYLGFMNYDSDDNDLSSKDSSKPVEFLFKSRMNNLLKFEQTVIDIHSNRRKNSIKEISSPAKNHFPLKSSKFGYQRKSSLFRSQNRKNAFISKNQLDTTLKVTLQNGFTRTRMNKFKQVRASNSMSRKSMKERIDSIAESVISRRNGKRLSPKELQYSHNSISPPLSSNSGTGGGHNIKTSEEKNGDGERSKVMFHPIKRFKKKLGAVGKPPIKLQSAKFIKKSEKNYDELNSSFDQKREEISPDRNNNIRRVIKLKKTKSKFQDNFFDKISEENSPQRRFKNSIEQFHIPEINLDFDNNCPVKKLSFDQILTFNELSLEPRFKFMEGSQKSIRYGEEKFELDNILKLVEQGQYSKIDQYYEKYSQGSKINFQSYFKNSNVSPHNFSKLNISAIGGIKFTANRTYFEKFSDFIEPKEKLKKPIFANVFFTHLFTCCLRRNNAFYKIDFSLKIEFEGSKDEIQMINSISDFGYDDDKSSKDKFFEFIRLEMKVYNAKDCFKIKTDISFDTMALLISPNSDSKMKDLISFISYQQIYDCHLQRNKLNLLKNLQSKLVLNDRDICSTNPHMRLVGVMGESRRSPLTSKKSFQRKRTIGSPMFKKRKQSFGKSPMRFKKLASARNKIKLLVRSNTRKSKFNKKSNQLVPKSATPNIFVSNKQLKNLSSHRDSKKNQVSVSPMSPEFRPNVEKIDRSFAISPDVFKRRQFTNTSKNYDMSYRLSISYLTGMPGMSNFYDREDIGKTGKYVFRDTLMTEMYESEGEGTRSYIKNEIKVNYFDLYDGVRMKIKGLGNPNEASELVIWTYRIFDNQSSRFVLKNANENQKIRYHHKSMSSKKFSFYMRSIIQYQKKPIGSVINKGLHNFTNLGIKPEPDFNNLGRVRSKIYQKDIQRRLKKYHSYRSFSLFFNKDLTFDFNLKMKAEVTIFTSYGSQRKFDNSEIIVFFNILPVKKRIKKYFLILNKYDIKKHFGGLEFLQMQKSEVIRRFDSFIKSLKFEKFGMYSKPIIKSYRDSFKYSCNRANVKEMSKKSFLVEAEYEKKIMTNFVKKCKVGGKYCYCIFNIFQHFKLQQVTIEIYFPKSRRTLNCIICHSDFTQISKEFWTKALRQKSEALMRIVKRLDQQTSEKKLIPYSKILELIELESSQTSPIHIPASPINKKRPSQHRNFRKLFSSESFLSLPDEEERCVNINDNEVDDITLKRYLKIFSWEKFILLSELNLNSRSLTKKIKMGNLKVILHEKLLTQYSSVIKKNPFYFTVCLKNPKSKNFCENYLKYSLESLAKFELYFKFLFINNGKTQNDKLNFEELVKTKMLDQNQIYDKDSCKNILKYIDLLNSTKKVYKKFLENFLKKTSKTGLPASPRRKGWRNPVNRLTKEIIFPEIPNLKPTKINSDLIFNKFLTSSLEKSERKYPFLIFKGIFTKKPKILEVIWMKNPELLVITYYNLESKMSKENEIRVKVVEQILPYFKKMIDLGLFKQVGERIRTGFKNSEIIKLGSDWCNDYFVRGFMQRDTLF